jgi:NADH:ubiquinone reductase (H+-translocating)
MDETHGHTDNSSQEITMWDNKNLTTAAVIPVADNQNSLIWAAGVRANPLADILGLPQGRGGRIKLNPDLSVPEHPVIFVVGDMGEVASEGKILPQLGSVAMQSGEHVAQQISRRLAGEPAQPFKYWDKGFMAGRSSDATGRNS